MLNDEGVLLDDGTVFRVAEDEFFVTVTTGNTAALERWITWWNADWQLDARVLNVTGAFAALNVAGPRARDVMRGLTTADVSAEAFPYMAGARFDVAGVASIVLRIGFVGELSYEIHLPSMYGEHVWDAVMEAGAAHGIAPFGLEAQRILRLEKQHILIGQDTDAESDPYEVGLGWMVKDDKPDFLGKRSLDDLAREGPRERLVGFTAPSRWLPPEGASVVRAGTWVGRVTSARRSAAAGSVVGLAWLPVDLDRRRDRFRDPVRRGAHRRYGPDDRLLRPCGSEAAFVRAAVRRSPTGRLVGDLHATLVEEAGWELAASFGDAAEERWLLRDRCALADITPRAKVDVRGDLEPVLGASLGGHVARIASGWALVVGGPGEESSIVSAAEAVAGPRTMVTDVTHLFAGFALAGPGLDAVLARTSSWDPSSLEPRIGHGGAGGGRARRRHPGEARGSRCWRSTSRRSSGGSCGRPCTRWWPRRAGVPSDGTRCAPKGGRRCIRSATSSPGGCGVATS